MLHHIIEFCQVLSTFNWVERGKFVTVQNVKCSKMKKKSSMINEHFTKAQNLLKIDIYTAIIKSPQGKVTKETL